MTPVKALAIIHTIAPAAMRLKTDQDRRDYYIALKVLSEEYEDISNEEAKQIQLRWTCSDTQLR